jgi:tetratricopeptide (TPR) repeat protein
MHVGTIMISPRAFEDRDTKRVPGEYIGFTGYVRCRHCDAGGPWLFPGMTMVQIIALVMLKLEGGDDVPIEVAELQTFDGVTVRYATQSEEHIRQLLEREPARAFLWTRLANVYRHAQLPKLAEAAYRRALELDAEDFEAHASLAQILEVTKRPREAIPHWQFVLALARSAAQTPLELRRECVRAAVEAILDAGHESAEGVPFSPPGHEPLRDCPREDPVVLQLREFDLSKERDMQALCDSFLGEQHKPRGNRITG